MKLKKVETKDLWDIDPNNAAYMFSGCLWNMDKNYMSYVWTGRFPQPFLCLKYDYNNPVFMFRLLDTRQILQNIQ